MAAATRPLGDESANYVCSIFGGEYYTAREVSTITVGAKLDALCQDGLNYMCEVVEYNASEDRGKLHFIKWSRKYDYKGSLTALYLAPMGQFSTQQGITAANAYLPLSSSASSSSKRKPRKSLSGSVQKAASHSDYLQRPRWNIKHSVSLEDGLPPSDIRPNTRGLSKALLQEILVEVSAPPVAVETAPTLTSTRKRKTVSAETATVPDSLEIRVSSTAPASKRKKTSNSNKSSKSTSRSKKSPQIIDESPATAAVDTEGHTDTATGLESPPQKIKKRQSKAKQPPKPSGGFGSETGIDTVVPPEKSSKKKKNQRAASADSDSRQEISHVLIPATETVPSPEGAAEKASAAPRAKSSTQLRTKLLVEINDNLRRTDKALEALKLDKKLSKVKQLKELLLARKSIDTVILDILQ